MDEAKKLIVLEQENEELKRELRELFKTLDQMNQSLNRMIDHYILCKTDDSEGMLSNQNESCGIFYLLCVICSRRVNSQIKSCIQETVCSSCSFFSLRANTS